MPTNKDMLSTNDYNSIGAAVASAMTANTNSVIAKLDEILLELQASPTDVTPVLHELQNMRLAWLWLWNHPGISFPSPPPPPFPVT